MDEFKKLWLPRILVGGIAGMALLFLVGGVFNDLVNGGLIAIGVHTPFQAVSYDLARLVGSDAVALAIQLALYFAIGAGVGVATLPFSDEGRELLVRSALHFGYTAVMSSALIWLCGWNWGSPLAWLAELGLVALLYVLIWGVRWLFWWFELGTIKEKLGLIRRKHEQGGNADEAADKAL